MSQDIDDLADSRQEEETNEITNKNRIIEIKHFVISTTFALCLVLMLLMSATLVAAWGGWLYYTHDAYSEENLHAFISLEGDLYGHSWNESDLTTFETSNWFVTNAESQCADGVIASCDYLTLKREAVAQNVEQTPPWVSLAFRVGLISGAVNGFVFFAMFKMDSAGWDKDI